MNAARSSELLIALTDVRVSDAGRVGYKAANLGELAAAGFTVPDGFTVPASVLSGLGDTDASSPELTRAVTRGLEALGGGPVAVRSSGLAEDLPGASFAGQYETVLNVRGVDAAMEALRRCRASADSERVRAYLAHRGEAGQPLGVLVQRMVPAEVSGVASSANPVTGARDECVINAVGGLGDRLVNGEVTPDEWRVGSDGPSPVDAPQGVLDADLAAEVADLARRCAAHFGCPQDIEWAVAGGQLHLLQARPITALREPPVTPDPPCPLFQEFFTRIAPAMQRNFTEAGMLMDGIEFRIIGGNVYQHIRPLGGSSVGMNWRRARSAPGPRSCRRPPARRSQGSRPWPPRART